MDFCFDNLTGSCVNSNRAISRIKVDGQAMTDLKAIKERLEKATLPVDMNDKDALLAFMISGDFKKYHRAVAELHAYSKSDITALLSDNEALRAEIETLKRHWIEDDRDLNELIKENETLCSTLKLAESALTDISQCRIIPVDPVKAANECLAKIKECLK